MVDHWPTMYGLDRGLFHRPVGDLSTSHKPQASPGEPPGEAFLYEPRLHERLQSVERKLRLSDFSRVSSLVGSLYQSPQGLSSLTPTQCLSKVVPEVALARNNFRLCRHPLRRMFGEGVKAIHPLCSDNLSIFLSA
jgi:hypothetical protein